MNSPTSHAVTSSLFFLPLLLLAAGFLLTTGCDTGVGAGEGVVELLTCEDLGSDNPSQNCGGVEGTGASNTLYGIRPPGWIPPSGFSIGYDLFDRTGDPCHERGLCMGGRLNRFGSFLAPPTIKETFPDSVQAVFGLVSTQNLVLDTSDPSEILVINKSGMESEFDFSIPDKPGVRLEFEYAFLTSGQDDDVAHVRLLVDGETISMLGLTADNLSDGDRIEGGCGTIDDSNTTINFGDSEFDPAAYPVCTDWTTRAFNLTPYRGQSARLQIITEEVGGKNEHPTTLLFDSFRLFVPD